MGAAWLRGVLAATDLSEGGNRAVGRAVRLGLLHGAPVTSVCVVPHGADADLSKHVRSRLRRDVSGYPGGARTAVAVRRGKVGPALVREVERRGAGLLVVGAHGKDRLADPLLGTTPENLSRSSGVPVLVVREPPVDDYRNVLLAVDTDALSFAAARYGIALSPGAEHRAVHTAVVPGEHMLRMHGASEEELARLLDVCLADVRPRIERLMAALPLAEGTRPLISSGRPTEAVPELADRYAADLVVVGTGARSKLAHALLGSVAQHVMRRAPCDVLVVRGHRVTGAAPSSLPVGRRDAHAAGGRPRPGRNGPPSWS
ncbi:universal stress protein [Streptomyces sp. GSL17-111]|uniref:universal stress protein n=1 Tax=Streptomyces sp. GSL17-111 TaxID=3121596 RepID=UPI0030F42211